MQPATSIRFNDTIAKQLDEFMASNKIKNRNFAIARLVLMGLQADKLKTRFKAGQANEILKEVPVSFESVSAEKWSELTGIDLMTGMERAILAHVLARGEIL